MSVDCSFESQEMWIRSDLEQQRTLLLKIRYMRLLNDRLEYKTSYTRYDSGRRDLVAADEAAWNSAGGQISGTRTRAYRQDSTHDLSEEFRERLANRDGIPAFGRDVVHVSTCPGGTIAAVMSVEEKRYIPGLPALLPFTGGGGRRRIIEPCYLQLFAASDGAPRSKPIRLRIAKDVIPYTYAWSADSRYLVFTDGSITNVFIIDTKTLKE